MHNHRLNKQLKYTLANILVLSSVYVFKANAGVIDVNQMHLKQVDINKIQNQPEYNNQKTTQNSAALKAISANVYFANTDYQRNYEQTQAQIQNLNNTNNSNNKDRMATFLNTTPAIAIQPDSSTKIMPEVMPVALAPVEKQAILSQMTKDAGTNKNINNKNDKLALEKKSMQAPISSKAITENIKENIQDKIQKTTEVVEQNITQAVNFVKNSLQKGRASWYGKPFHGRTTANGEKYNMYANTAAHRTLPLGTYVKVTNHENQKSTIVRINDRGPYAHNRLIDLSFAAAQKLDFIKSGIAKVDVQVIKK